MKKYIEICLIGKKLQQLLQLFLLFMGIGESGEPVLARKDGTPLFAGFQNAT
jgi:hypothetical protein